MLQELIENYELTDDLSKESLYWLARSQAEAGQLEEAKDGYGKLYFELDNGQVWRQIEYERFPAKTGDVAEIRHGSFGSYKMSIQGKKITTRVRRAQ